MPAEPLLSGLARDVEGCADHSPRVAGSARGFDGGTEFLLGRREVGASSHDAPEVNRLPCSVVLRGKLVHAVLMTSAVQSAIATNRRSKDPAAASIVGCAVSDATRCYRRSVN